MANSKITGAADDLADDVADAGKKAASGARKAGAGVADAVKSGSSRGASQLRRSARQGEAAYDDAADAISERVGSIEDTIRRNPLASAGAALLVGVVLGRFFL